MLTECEYADNLFYRLFVTGQNVRTVHERPYGILGERQNDDGHFGRTDVHDAHPRVYEAGQGSPEFVQVGERGLIEAEFAARLVDHGTQFGVRQRACKQR